MANHIARRLRRRRGCYTKWVRQRKGVVKIQVLGAGSKKYLVARLRKQAQNLKH